MPRRVRVKGRKIPVRRRRLLPKLIGLAYPPQGQDPGEIVLEKSLRGRRALGTLVHEMLHHMNFRFSEKTILKLEEGLVELVEDNPEVFRDLWEG